MLCLGKERVSSEILSGDTFAILAVHVLLEVYSNTADKIHLYNAISALERAYAISPANAQVKLLLFRVHTMLGLVQYGGRFGLSVYA